MEHLRLGSGGQHHGSADRTTTRRRDREYIVEANIIVFQAIVRVASGLMV